MVITNSGSFWDRRLLEFISFFQIYITNADAKGRNL